MAFQAPGVLLVVTLRVTRRRGARRGAGAEATLGWRSQLQASRTDAALPGHVNSSLSAFLGLSSHISEMGVRKNTENDKHLAQPLLRALWAELVMTWGMG